MKYGIQKYVVVTKENLVREVMLDEILTFISRMSNTKFDMQVRKYYWITLATLICFFKTGYVWSPSGLFFKVPDQEKNTLHIQYDWSCGGRKVHDCFL